MDPDAPSRRTRCGIGGGPPGYKENANINLFQDSLNVMLRAMLTTSQNAEITDVILNAD
jgi:hypothetical protein